MRKILLYIIERLHRLTYEKVTLDKVNQKLIRPVPGLVINGVQYWEYVNAADMPQGRLVHYTYLREEMSMGVDRATLNDYIAKLNEASAKQEFNRVASLLGMLEDTINNLTSIESLFNMATLWYFDKNEDLKTYDYDYNQEKVKAFKRFQDKGFFFGNLLRVSLRHTGLSLPADIQQFLNENAVKLRAYAMIRGGQDVLSD